MKIAEPREIVWSDYFRYRVELRGYNLSNIEKILRYSEEKYYDTETFRQAVVGRHDKWLVIIPYDTENNTVIPVTVHTVTRQQIKFRIKTGRLVHEKTQNEIFSGK